ncbi:MAG: hypothetical protein ACKVJK_12650 [Methylophagaceae bacterium]|jgi:hypothetical protein|tara:strand:+ start:19 stop:453 length:435 start_codon:yes stop_codon:yes gene_type:complete
MPITTVTTSQAPDAKPVAKNLVLSTTSAEIINVPNYRVPELVFGGSTTVEPGVGEIISPLVLCNVTNATVNVGVRVFRYYEGGAGTYFNIIKQLPVPAYDTIAIPLNGQFLNTGDILEAEASANLAIHATLSFTLGQAEEDDVV